MARLDALTSLPPASNYSQSLVRLLSSQHAFVPQPATLYKAGRLISPVPGPEINQRITGVMHGFPKGKQISI